MEPIDCSAYFVSTEADEMAEAETAVYANEVGFALEGQLHHASAVLREANLSQGNGCINLPPFRRLSMDGSFTHLKPFNQEIKAFALG